MEEGSTNRRSIRLESNLKTRFSLRRNRNSSLPPLSEPCPQGLRRGIGRRCAIGEKMRILLLESVFAFPYELRTSPRVPLNLDNWKVALLQPLDFSIHDFYRFLQNLEFGTNMKSIY
ncbi:hypothetical protein Tco_1156610 [Tanacetum coccineum]